MTPAQLAFEHIGQKGSFPLANGGGEVVGTLSRIRHAAQGTYIELEEHLGVYPTDRFQEIKGAS
jgi:hypothetical protein